MKRAHSSHSSDSETSEAFPPRSRAAKVSRITSANFIRETCDKLTRCNSLIRISAVTQSAADLFVDHAVSKRPDTLSKDDQATTAAALWIAIKFVERRSRNPNASFMAYVADVPSRDLLEKERQILDALDFDLATLLVDANLLVVADM